MQRRRVGVRQLGQHDEHSGDLHSAADGTGLARLTNSPGSDGEPAWSPDGTKIAFDFHDGHFGIYVMNADGSGLTRLASNPTDDRVPAWSPDGGKIAFMSFRDGNWEI